MTILKEFIEKAINRENLSFEESQRAFQIIMHGGATPVQMAGLLVALRMKGESIDEITGAATVMRAKCGKLKAPAGALDTCGTGGDSSGSFNISTAVAFVVAGCGVPVAKHGNRAISSKSGSADVLRELGVNIEAEVDIMEKALDEAGICFMMAPKFHKAMRHVAPVRQELGVRTIFNVLGPLSNPAQTKFQLLGVYSDHLVEPLAHVLNNLGTESAWVVHGSDGMDEITTTGKTHIASLKDGKVKIFELDPTDYGFELATPDDLRGGDAHENANALRSLLLNRGNKYYRDIVLLNSAACLVITGKAENIPQAIEMSINSIESYKANDALLKLAEVTNS